MENLESNSSRCYDVFLSFRGEDTRHTFTGNLYDAFRRKGINTFMDDDDGLKGGDQISLSLVKAIEESKISVVVFSQNYASSSWCLDELVKIVEWKNTKSQLVWPIFYKVAPSDVRHQRNSYAEAMAEHECRFGKESPKVQEWRSALSQVANLKGWHFETGYEYEFIQMIVEMAIDKLHREQLDVGEHKIGHKSRIQEVKSLLDIESSDKVCMVGIHGTGGIGKTTLAKALYNLIFYQFECAIFLEGVRETSKSMGGLVHLQEAMLSKLLEGKIIKLSSVDEGAARLKDRLRHRRILLVLDDVDGEEQLEKLAGNCNWFGKGSRIIITTRDMHVLTIHEVENRYEMKELNDDEALQLFRWKAFKMSQPDTKYNEVSKLAVHYAKGLPLALKVIGSNLVGKSVKECECALDQYERIPDRKIQDILKVSYECLPENAQFIFLDIACFFKGEKREYVERILERCDFFPTFNIGILVDKSLLTVDKYGHLRMHDLIQDMGKEIVRQESPRRPGERSRLHLHEDILSVLTEKSGSNNIEGIILDPPMGEEIEVDWSCTAFKKMNNLRILILRNARFLSAPKYLPSNLRLLEWKGYPSESLPPGFDPRNIVVLRLPQSHLRLEKENTLLELKHLTELDFSKSQMITHVPDMSGVPSLKCINFSGCSKLVTIDKSVGFLEKLESLDAGACEKLRNFTSSMWLPSLQVLFFGGCSSLQSFPEIERVMDKPLSIYLNGTKIRELPSSVYKLTGLKTVWMFACREVRNLPNSLFTLPKIVVLAFQGNFHVRKSFRSFQNSLVMATSTSHSPLRILSCIDCGLRDEDLQCILSCFPNLEELILPGNYFVSLPSCIKESSNLRVLDVTSNERLKEIPDLPSSVQKVLAGWCSSLTSQSLRMLWSQALNEVYKLHVLMPKSQFPNWFDHHCEGGTVSFWARGQFPIVALAFVFEGMPLRPRIRRRYRICIHLYINGRENAKRRWSGGPEGDSLLLCDVRSGDGAVVWPIPDMLDASDWSHVEFKCDSPGCLIVSYCGVHVYKHETKMEDIQFTEGRPSSISHNPPKKRVKMF